MFCFCGLKAAHFLWFFALCFVTSGHEKGSEIKVVVLEGSDAILPCSLNTKESVVQELFDWMKKAPNKQEVFMYDGGLHYNNGRPGQHEHFRGRVSHFPQELQFGNASIIIRNTMVADSGVYTCFFPRLPTQQIFNIRLVVGAAPKPYVTILKENGLLECEVPGASPKPTVEWWDSDNKTLPSKTVQDKEEQGRFHVIVQTTVTEPGCYRCVAKQMEKWHRISSEICVHHGLPVWAAALIGGFIVVVIGVAVGVGVVLKVKGYSLKKDSQRMENGPSSELERNLTSEQP